MTEAMSCTRGEAIRAGRIEAPDQPHDSATGPPITGRIPFRSRLREQVQAAICNDCWQQWLQMQIKIINEMALNLGDPRSHEIIEAHARDFFGLSEERETTTDFARIGEVRPPGEGPD